MNKNLDNLDPVYGLDWTKMDGSVLAVLQEDTTNEIVAYGTMTKIGLSNSLVAARYGLPWRTSFFHGNPVQIVQKRKDCDCDTLLFRIRLLFSDFEPFRLAQYDSQALIALASVIKDELMVAVIQDQATKDVLMVGVMNAEAVRTTVETGLATLWSRSRGELWTKGETSGNFLRMKGFLMSPLSCSVVLQVDPVGPVCHTGARTCFLEPDGSIRHYVKGEAR